MKTRILSALIMLPLLLIVYFGGYVLLAGCIAIAVIASREFTNGFKEIDVYPSYGIVLGAIVALYALNIFGLVSAEWYMLWIFASALASFLYLFSFDKRKLEDGMATLVTICYVVFFSYHVTLIDQTKYGILIWVVFTAAFGTDIFAYFTGYLFGKHKLCPLISPKKTVEGAIGGIIGSLILSGAFGFIFAPEIAVHCIIIGALGGVISQLGDLTASVFKRKMGIKDYGKLIPGHGGIMDRFDSVLFVAPLVYYYIAIVLA